MLVHQIRRCPYQIVDELREGGVVRNRGVVGPSAGHLQGILHVVTEVVPATLRYSSLAEPKLQ
jgi:hypothetical protein